MRRFLKSVLILGIILNIAAAFYSVAAHAGELQFADKPAPETPERKAVPPSDSAFDDWKRVPYQESAPEPEPTASEKEFGAILFSRPLVDAIYPETKPRGFERLETISGFGAWGQYETLNMALYPLTDLKNVSVRLGGLHGAEGVIPADAIEIRLVTYRDVCYPGYNSKGAWRRLPEYLQNVTTSDAVKQEPQRFCVTIHVPEGIAGGLYKGNLLVSHDGCERAVSVPVEFEVFPFALKRDPEKRCSAYYYPPSRHVWVTSKQKDEEWARGVMAREFETMAKYGFDFCPTISLGVEKVDDKLKLAIHDLDFIVDLMKKNKMRGPILVIGGPFTWLCTSKYKIEIGSHLTLDKLPPEEYYAEMGELINDFKKEMVEKNYPEMVFGPLDEISSDPKSCEYGCRIYDLFKKAGLKTYTTMEPENPGFTKIDPYIDIFGTQAYLPRFEEIAQGRKAAYWCYPNHNSYERKDMVIMCKGGRMTYGFGLWRSGFNLLIPWIWRTSNPNHFYRERGSGGGNILHPETGEVIMTIYWENFREGMNDLSYLYTLEEAAAHRAESTDAAVQKNCADAKILLQKIWDSIVVQDKYLNQHLWASEEFDARRLQMAVLIRELYRSPETNQRPTPSVIIEPRILNPADSTLDDLYREAAAQDNVSRYLFTKEDEKNLGWISQEAEAALSVVENVPGAAHAKTLLLDLNIDTVVDGTGNKAGKYPAGWPGMFFSFPNDAPAMSNFDFLFVRFKVESNRKTGEKPVDTPFIYSLRFQPEETPALSFSPKQTGIEDEWHEACYPLADRGYEGVNGTNKIYPKGIRPCIAESRYEDKTRLKLYFDELSFITLKKPMISGLTVPAACRLATGGLCFETEFYGRLDGVKNLTATLIGEQGEIAQSVFSPLSEKNLTGRLAFPSGLAGGPYTLRFELIDAADTVVAEKSAAVELIGQ